MNATTLTMAEHGAAGRAEISSGLAPGSAGSRVAAADIPTPRWLARLGLHLAIASIPVLAISPDVFGWISLRAVTVGVLRPMLAVTAIVVTPDRHRSDRVILAGFIWGLLACAGYDAFRLPSIYLAHLWTDFFGAVGGLVTGTSSNYLVGDLWRYAGDGAGIGVVFFALAACREAQPG